MHSILELYLDLHEKRIPEDGERLRSVWHEILSDPRHHLLVNETGGEIVSSCVCVIVPNLTRNLRPYAVVENVVTRADRRGKGYATQCLDRAGEIAAGAGCYKIMLLTGAKDAATLDFYRHAGYDSGEKTAFIRRLNHS